MTSILIRLPEGCAPPTHLVMPEDVPILATLLDDAVSYPLMQLLPPNLALGCITLPDRQLDLSPTPETLPPAPPIGNGWTPAIN